MTNNFVEIIPRLSILVRDKRNVIRTSFVFKHSTVKDPNWKQMVLYIGRDITDSLNLHMGDRVQFSYNPNDLYIWSLKKSKDKSGFKLNGSVGGASLKIQITWVLFDIKAEDRFVKTVKHEVIDEEIMIYADVYKGA